MSISHIYLLILVLMKNAIREILLTLYKIRLVESQQKAFQVEGTSSMLGA